MRERACLARRRRSKSRTDLKVPPSVGLRDKEAHDGLELAGRHLRQMVVADDGAAAGGLAADDVAAGGLRAGVAVEAVVKVGAGPGAEGCDDAAGGGRGPLGEGGDEMGADMAVVFLVGVDELLEDLECVGRVAAAADGKARCPQLRVLFGIMGDAGMARLRTVGERGGGLDLA